MPRHLALATLLAAGLEIAATSATFAQTATNTERQTAMTQITVTIGEETLTATLDDTAAARDFAAMLPLELTLSDFHGIEKIADLPRAVDTSQAPASYDPSRGDITIYAPWGNLAIFYEDFRESRGLVRLGAFDGPIDALIRDGDTPIRIQPLAVGQAD